MRVTVTSWYRQPITVPENLVGRGWVHLVLRPLPAPNDRRWWLWGNWWNEDWQGKSKYTDKICPSSTFSTTNPIWPDPGSNPGRCGGKPATNRLSYGAAFCWAHFTVCGIDRGLHVFSEVILQSSSGDWFSLYAIGWHSLLRIFTILVATDGIQPWTSWIHTHGHEQATSGLLFIASKEGSHRLLIKYNLRQFITSMSTGQRVEAPRRKQFNKCNGKWIKCTEDWKDEMKIE
jgi:hypothetical protein